jgi:hypothetical protein
MTTALTLAAALAIAAAGIFPAQAAPADEQLNDVLQQYRSAETRGQWINTLMPEATGLASAAPSGDQHLNRLVATYTREQLDRGGWANAWVTTEGYAAGEPLLAVRVGDGVTTRVAAAPAPVQQFALALRR